MEGRHLTAQTDIKTVLRQLDLDYVLEVALGRGRLILAQPESPSSGRTALRPLGTGTEPTHLSPYTKKSGKYPNTLRRCLLARVNLAHCGVEVTANRNSIAYFASIKCDFGLHPVPQTPS
jgi:hypothetical protein